MAFFHTTPLGRIINRLTKDTVDADKNLADFGAFFLRSLLQLASTIVLIGVVTPFALPALLPILLLFYFLYQYFQVRCCPQLVTGKVSGGHQPCQRVGRSVLTVRAINDGMHGHPWGVLSRNHLPPDFFVNRRYAGTKMPLLGDSFVMACM